MPRSGRRADMPWRHPWDRDPSSSQTSESARLYARRGPWWRSRMTEGAELDGTVKRMLESETFEPDELTEVLVKKGHDAGEVRGSIERVRADLEADANRPAAKQAARRRKRAARLVRAGVLILGFGLVLTLAAGGGFLYLLVVIAVGGAFIAAGYRGLRG